MAKGAWIRNDWEIIKAMREGTDMNALALTHHCRKHTLFHMYRRRTGESYRTWKAFHSGHPIYWWQSEIGLGGEIQILEDDIGLLIIRP